LVGRLVVETVPVAPTPATFVTVPPGAPNAKPPCSTPFAGMLITAV
jgi:hypothetical protein